MQGLIDSTLREGAQTVEVKFSLKEQRAIVDGLGRVGIEEIEAGVVGSPNPHLPRLLADYRASGFKGRVALWCRCLSADIALAGRLGPDILSLSIPVSDLHIEKKLGRTRQWVKDTAQAAISQAVELGFPMVSLGLEDATRAEPEFLEEMVKTAAEAGAGRIRLADTVGIAGPQDIQVLIKLIKKCASISIAVHCHNDFGMATANSLAALEAGADWTDVTVLGLGERAGNARLEELAGFLAVRRGRDYRLRELAPLCQTVARAAGRSIEPHHPLVGRKIFACETGLHVQGLLRAPETYEPFSPAQVGAVRQMLFGAKTGKRAIADLLARAGARPALPELEGMVETIHKAAHALGRPLVANEVGRHLLPLNRLFTD